MIIKQWSTASQSPYFQQWYRNCDLYGIFAEDMVKNYSLISCSRSTLKFRRVLELHFYLSIFYFNAITFISILFKEPFYSAVLVEHRSLSILPECTFLRGRELILRSIVPPEHFLQVDNQKIFELKYCI